MTTILRIKRRAASDPNGAGPPDATDLMNAELAFNEADNTLYYGAGDDGSGGAVSVIAIGGDGAGLPEVPIDGITYGRKDETWEPVLPLTGGTLTGALTLAADPANAAEAATKAYVDATAAAAGVATFNTRTGDVVLAATDVSAATGLLTTGGTMTGALVLAANAALPLEAVPLQQLTATIAAIPPVDLTPYVLKAGDTMTGALVLAANAALPLEAVPLQQLTATIAAIPPVDLSPYVLKAGDTMTGALLLPAVPPVDPVEATSKSYVDAGDAALQSQVDLLASNLLFSGSIDVVLDAGDYTDASAMIDGVLPAAAAGNANFYVIVTTGGTAAAGNIPAGTYAAGDWIVSDGTAWIQMPIGQPTGSVSEAPVDTFTYGRKDAAWSEVLPITGGTLTGPLQLPAAVANAPIGPNQAVNKRQLDWLIAPPPVTAGPGTDVAITTPDGIGALGGGLLSLAAGASPTGIGGYITLRAGGGGLVPGSIELHGAPGTVGLGVGGPISVTGGSGSSGGSIWLLGGDASGDQGLAGGIRIVGGTHTSATTLQVGGHIEITAGPSTGATSYGGSVAISGGEATASFGGDILIEGGVGALGNGSIRLANLRTTTGPTTGVIWNNNGALNIGAGITALPFDLAAGTEAPIERRVGGLMRWRVALGNNTPETPEGQGTDFTISRFANNGDPIDSVINISRQSGVVDFKFPPTVEGAPLGGGGDFLPLTGGTLTGALQLPAAVANAAVLPTQAINRQQLDWLIAPPLDGLGGGADVRMTASDATGALTAGAVYINGGESPIGIGGYITLQAGGGGLIPGALQLYGAPGVGALNAGGPVYIYAGSGTGNGGGVRVAGGDMSGDVGAAGVVTIIGGANTSAASAQRGGIVEITGGPSTGAASYGGTVTISGGEATAAGGGDVTIGGGVGPLGNGDILFLNLRTTASSASAVWNNNGVLNIGAGGTSGGGGIPEPVGAGTWGRLATGAWAEAMPLIGGQPSDVAIGSGTSINITAGTSTEAYGGGGNLNLTGGAPGLDGSAGRVIVRGGSGSGAGAGGPIELWGGEATGTGASGEVGVYGGMSVAGTGGGAFLQAGNSETGNAGNVTITGGITTAGTGRGGLVSIWGGDSLAAPGTIDIRGGNATAGSAAYGADVSITAGSGDGAGIPGNLVLSAGSNATSVGKILAGPLEVNTTLTIDNAPGTRPVAMVQTGYGGYAVSPTVGLFDTGANKGMGITYVSVGNAFYLGEIDATGSGAATRQFLLVSGHAVAGSNAAGGVFEINGPRGDGTGAGGAITIQGGVAGATGVGGAVRVGGGYGMAGGGDLVLDAGDYDIAGSGAGPGGNVRINGGQGTVAGGSNIILQPGVFGAGLSGSIELISNGGLLLTSLPTVAQPADAVWNNNGVLNIGAGGAGGGGMAEPIGPGTWGRLETGAWAEAMPLTGGTVTGRIVLSGPASGIFGQTSAPGSGVAGGTVRMTAGAGDGSRDGGDIQITSGTGGATGGGGLINIIAGNAIASGGGAATVRGGAGTTRGGNAVLRGGDVTSATGYGGDAQIYGGTTTAGYGGSIVISAGDSVPVGGLGGIITMLGGRAGADGVGGGVTIQGGAVSSIASAATTGGDVRISGGVIDTTGSDGQGGNVVIACVQPGTTAGPGATPGLIILQDLPTVDPARTGALWRDPATNALMVSP